MNIRSFNRRFVAIVAVCMGMLAIVVLLIFTAEKSHSVRILSVGDVMLGRYVRTLMEREGFEYPFEHAQDILRGYDIVIGNLEGPILENARHTPDGSTTFSFVPEVADLLKQSGMTHVTLANNHTHDFGREGLESTRSYVAAAGIVPFGHPKAVNEQSVTQFRIDGTSIALIGLNATDPSLDIEAAASLIRQYAHSFVIAEIHWGTEYQHHANDRQKLIAHTLIDAGADAVIGHHPHVVQGIERYGDGIIFYSLGNFIFDQYFSKDTQEALALSIALDTNHVSYMLLPIQIVKSQPGPHPDPARLLREVAGYGSPDIADLVASGVLTL